MATKVLHPPITAESELEIPNLKAEFSSEYITLAELDELSASVAANPQNFTYLLNKRVRLQLGTLDTQYDDGLFEIIELARYDLADESRKAGFVLMSCFYSTNTYTYGPYSNKQSGSSVSGGWGSSTVRATLSAMTVPSQVKSVKIPYAATTSDTVASYSTDKIFIPSCGELIGKDSSGFASLEGDRFAGLATTPFELPGKSRANSAAATSGLMTRTLSNSSQYRALDGDASYRNNYPGYSCKIRPCFCV